MKLFFVFLLCYFLATVHTYSLCGLQPRPGLTYTTSHPLNFGATVYQTTGARFLSLIPGYYCYEITGCLTVATSTPTVILTGGVFAGSSYPVSMGTFYTGSAFGQEPPMSLLSPAVIQPFFLGTSFQSAGGGLCQVSAQLVTYSDPSFLNTGLVFFSANLSGADATQQGIFISVTLVPVH